MSYTIVKIVPRCKNIVFNYKRYSFTREKPILLVDIDIAYELINKFDGFQILEAKDLERFRKNK
jgi:hypothetical protein